MREEADVRDLVWSLFFPFLFVRKSKEADSPIGGLIQSYAAGQWAGDNIRYAY